MEKFISLSDELKTLKKKMENYPVTWTRLPDTSGGDFLFRRVIHKNYSIYLNNLLNLQVNEQVPIGHLKDKYKRVDKTVIFASLNSVFTYIGMELSGRANLGEGALKMEIVDYRLIPIVNPLWLEEKLKSNGVFEYFKKITERILTLKPLHIDAEMERKERIELERLMLELLGLTTGDVKDLYNELIKLARIRTERARNTSM